MKSGTQALVGLGIVGALFYMRRKKVATVKRNHDATLKFKPPVEVAGSGDPPPPPPAPPPRPDAPVCEPEWFVAKTDRRAKHDGFVHWGRIPSDLKNVSVAKWPPGVIPGPGNNTNIVELEKSDRCPRFVVFIAEESTTSAAPFLWAEVARKQMATIHNRGYIIARAVLPPARVDVRWFGLDGWGYRVHWANWYDEDSTDHFKKGNVPSLPESRVPGWPLTIHLRGSVDAVSQWVDRFWDQLKLEAARKGWGDPIFVPEYE